MPVFYYQNSRQNKSADRKEKYFKYLVITKLKKTPCPESAIELYQPSDYRLSARLVPTFTDRGCSVVRVTDPYNRILNFLDREMTTKQTKTNKLRGLSPRANYTDRRLAKLVPTFAARGCHMVMTTTKQNYIHKELKLGKHVPLFTSQRIKAREMLSIIQFK
jgi:hypothetical protein